MWRRFPVGLAQATVISFVLTLAGHTPAGAQSCWLYSDSQPAKVPLDCVQQGNPALACSWNPI